MPDSVRQMILITLRHSSGWNDERLMENLWKANKTPREIAARELNMLVNENVVERREDGFVSLPDIEPNGFVSKILLALQSFIDRLLLALQKT